MTQPASLELVTHRRSIQEFLKEAESLFLDPIAQDGLQQLSRNLRKQLLERLETDMECMLPSYSHQLPRGTEVGRFVALDVGGSTLRVALVELCGRMSNIGEQSKIISMRNFYISPDIKALEGMAFFDWMAERIMETLSAELEQHDRSGGPLLMSMAWSFPIEYVYPYSCLHIALTISLDKHHWQVASCRVWAKAFVHATAC